MKNTMVIASSTFFTQASTTMLTNTGAAWFTSTVATSAFSGPIIFTGTGGNNQLKIDPNFTYPVSTSVGGAVLLENTGNTGAGLIIYSNAGASTGRLLNIRADNAAFDQAALHIDYDGTTNALEVVNNSTDSSSQAFNVVSNNPNDSSFTVAGEETGKGTAKIVHTGTGTDANASAVSIDLQGTGTAAQGIFIDATEGGTTGKLLNLRNSGTEYLTLTSGGFLGISTTSPYAMLSVAGKGVFTSLVSTSTLSCTEALETDANGLIICGTDATGAGGGAWSFTVGQDYAGLLNTQSTTSPLWIKNNLLAASTTFFTMASTTGLTNTGSTWLTGLTSALLGTDNTGKVVSTTTIGTNLLSANTISGVSLGGTLGALTNDTTLVGSSYTGAAAISDWGIDLANANTWTGLQQFGNSTSTLGTITTAWIGTLNLTNDLTVANGGTGASTLTGLLVGNGASAFTAIAGTTCTNQFLRAFTSSGGTCATVSLTADVTGTLPLANGGTNASLSGANQILFMNSGNTAVTSSSNLQWQSLGMLIGTSTSQLGTLTIGTSTAPQLVLADNSGVNAPFTFRAISNTLYLSTSTATATSSNPVLAIDQSKVGSISVSSSSPWAQIAFNLDNSKGTFQNLFVLASSTAIQMRIDNSGHLFLPQLTTDAAAHTYTMCGEATTFQAIWDTTTCVLSAAKFKTNIAPLDIGLAELLKVQPVSFNWKPTGDATYDNDINTKHQQMGVIADSVEKIDSRLVTYDNEGNIKGFRYDFFTAWLTKSIQDLAAKVFGLEARMDAQDARIKALEDKLK